MFRVLHPSVLLLVSSIMFLFLMILVDIVGFFQLLVKVMYQLFSINLNFMLKNISLVKSNPFNLIGVVSISHSQKYSNNMASLIDFLALTLTNKMVPLSTSIVISLKPVLPYYLMLMFLGIFGMMHLSQLVTCTTRNLHISGQLFSGDTKVAAKDTSLAATFRGRC